MIEKKGDDGGLSRRLFMKGAIIAGAVLGLPRAVWAIFIKKFPVRTVEKGTWDFDPEVGRLKYSTGGSEDYRLEVTGLVEEETAFSYADLRGFNLVEQISDFHCVEGWSVADLTWRGFRFSEVLSRVKPLAEAKYAIFHSLGETSSQPGGLDHYRESLPLDRLVDESQEILLALDLDGSPLAFEHGSPLRVISPYDLAYKSAKYVTRIELSDKPQAGWWTAANPIYPIEAPVPEGRLRKE